jgi:hypothetical protein
LHRGNEKNLTHHEIIKLSVILCDQRDPSSSVYFASRQLNNLQFTINAISLHLFILHRGNQNNLLLYDQCDLSFSCGFSNSLVVGFFFGYGCASRDSNGNDGLVVGSSGGFLDCGSCVTGNDWSESTLLNLIPVRI